MSSVQVDQPARMSQHPSSKKENDGGKSRKQFSSSHKKHNKHDDGRGGGGGIGNTGSHFGFNKFGRKRAQSNSGNKFFPPYKRRKKEGIIIPPTKFLLGGNIWDPLNLNSMQDEEVNRAMNAVTPKSSPLPTPKHKREVIELLIPPNSCDPLNLTCNDNEEYEKQLLSPLKRASKRRNKKRKRACSSLTKDEAADENLEVKKEGESTEQCSEAMECSVEKSLVESSQPEDSGVRQNKNCSRDPQKDKTTNVGKLGSKSERDDKSRLRLKGLEEPKDKRLRKDTKDKIVSPVIPQPGAWKSRLQHRPNQDKKKKQQQQTMPNFREKDARYQYGNYNRYYGYRNPGREVDPRLKVFAMRKELFLRKDILDIGCNIGHITLSVARDFGAKSVTGIDIDRTLINIARKNVRHYVNCVQSPASNEDTERTGDSDSSFFPMSMPIIYGPVDIPGFTKHKQDKGFPYNVTFVQGNYVLEDDALLYAEQPQFDTILCLSITKWIHLNFGDAGLKRAFKRMYAQLRPGGVLVLEPQDWTSYGRKKNLTERVYKNYHNIEFRPQTFTHYLLSSEIGFYKCEVVSIPSHPFKGFQRPLHLFTKPEQSNDNVTYIPDRREIRESEEQREAERLNYERELFPKMVGSTSERSQLSGDMNKYEHLENIYVPGGASYYSDTPNHNEQQSQDAVSVCYMDMRDEKEMEVESADKAHDDAKEMEETTDGVNKVRDNDMEIKRTREAADGDDGVEMETTEKEIGSNNDKEMLEVGNGVNETSENGKESRDAREIHDSDKETLEIEEAKDGSANERHDNDKEMTEVEIVEGKK